MPRHWIVPGVAATIGRCDHCTARGLVLEFDNAVCDDDYPQPEPLKYCRQCLFEFGARAFTALRAFVTP